MTKTGIRQSELMGRHKLKPAEIVKFRDENLTRDVHWWKEGTVIYWTEEAAKSLELKDKPEASPQPEGEIIQIRVARACPNPRFVIGDLNGFKASVRCGAKHSRRIVGKTVNVRVTKEAGETIYEYVP